MRTNASFRLVVRFARRNTLFYDEDITALPRLVSAVYVGMKAMEISRYGQHDARSRLVRFSTELLKLNFQTRPKIWREQSCFYNELSALSPGWRRSADRTCLRADSLLTGNFTGKLTILVAQRQNL
jgi:hypothetical protein